MYVCRNEAAAPKISDNGDCILSSMINSSRFPASLNRSPMDFDDILFPELSHNTFKPSSLPLGISKNLSMAFALSKVNVAANFKRCGDQTRISLSEVCTLSENIHSTSTTRVYGRVGLNPNTNFSSHLHGDMPVLKLDAIKDTTFHNLVQPSGNRNTPTLDKQQQHIEGSWTANKPSFAQTISPEDSSKPVKKVKNKKGRPSKDNSDSGASTSGIATQNSFDILDELDKDAQGNKERSLVVYEPQPSDTIHNNTQADQLVDKKKADLNKPFETLNNSNPISNYVLKPRDPSEKQKPRLSNSCQRANVLNCNKHRAKDESPKNLRTTLSK
ncbi:hypothetical protein DH2020_005549 [Rehmannia glutinosa]|uniref:Uncharacterized protein n=1 Tax=Rehmannia glutinosa TaxID=99300 RepID=A0ABR0XG90_REHGL